MKARKIVKRCLPIQLCKLHLSVEIFVSGQSFPFHFGAGLEHVRERVLFPPPQVTLHGCHDDHWLQLPFTEIKSTISDMKALNRVWTADVLNWKTWSAYTLQRFLKTVSLCKKTWFKTKTLIIIKSNIDWRRRGLNEAAVSYQIANVLDLTVINIRISWLNTQTLTTLRNIS